MNILDDLFGFAVDGTNVVPYQSYILVFDTCRWTLVPFSSICDECGGGGSGGPIPSRELVINTVDPEIAGKQYNSFANAFAYCVTQIPSATNTFAIRFSGRHTENIVIPKWVTPVGDGQDTSILAGTVDFEETGTALIAIENRINNCTIENLAVTNVISPDGVAATTPTPFVADTIEYYFQTPPTGGTYTLTLNGTLITLNWNDNATTIRNTINAAFGMPFGVVVIGTGVIGDPFIIKCNKLPAPGTTYSFDSSGLTPATIIQGNVTPAGITEIQRIQFTNIPTAGTWRIQITLGATTYATGNDLAYNISGANLLTEIQSLFTLVEIGQGFPAGSLGGATVTVVYSGSQQYDITLTGYPGNTPQINVPASPYSVTRSVGKGMIFNCVKITGATPDGVNTGSYIQGSGCEITGGDFSSFHGSTGVFDDSCFISSYVRPTSAIIIPDHWTFTSSQITGNSLASLTINDDTFVNCSITDSNYITFAAGIRMRKCSIEEPFTLTSGLKAFGCFFKDLITIDTGGVLSIWGCVLEAGYVLAGSGIFSNLGVCYDPRISGLTSVETQGAIDELAGGERLIADRPGLDLKVATQYVLYTVPTGKSFVITKEMIICTQAAAITVGATVSTGQNASCDDGLITTTLALLNKYTQQIIQPDATGMPIVGSRVFQAGEIIKFGVDTPATGALQEARVLLFGQLI